MPPARPESSAAAELVRALNRLTTVALLIGIGAVRVAFEGVERWLRTMRGSGSAAAPVRQRVPLLPIHNYSRLDPTEVIARLAALTPEQLQQLRRFEAEGRNRAEILEAIDRRLAEVPDANRSVHGKRRRR
jgi:hypothetical protein